jgi:hypothetical protein
MVLKDQLAIMKVFIMLTLRFEVDNSADENMTFKRTTVIQSHLDRVEKMEKLAEKTYQAVSSHKNIVCAFLTLPAEPTSRPEAETGQCLRGRFRTKASGEYSYTSQSCKRAHCRERETSRSRQQHGGGNSQAGENRSGLYSGDHNIRESRSAAL